MSGIDKNDKGRPYMTRSQSAYVITEAPEDGPIGIRYGLDSCSGYFLAVCDTRLQWEEGSEETMDFRSEFTGGLSMYLFPNVSPNLLGPGGNGFYCQLGTADSGKCLGTSVSPQVMASFWKSYGVPQEHIDIMLADRDLPEPTVRLCTCLLRCSLSNFRFQLKR